MKTVTIPYKPRMWQLVAHKKLKRFNVMVIHRRAGKTVFAVMELMKHVMTCKLRRPQVAYIAPTYSQAKKIAWEYLKDYTRGIPNIKVNESELRIDLPNGGRIMVLGADNPDSLRGLYLDYAVLDEVADMPSSLWGTVIRPALADRQGGALFIGTPKGYNKFHELYENGLSKTDWYSNKLDYTRTGALNQEEIDALKSELSEEEFAQEMMCDFGAAIKGAYFAKEITELVEDGRIRFVPYDKDHPVITGWDIGFDGTVIWYAQIIGEGIHIINCDILKDQDVREASAITKGHPYKYDYHILPHDAKKRAITNASHTTMGVIKSLTGVRCVIAPKLDLLEGINLTRRFLGKCVFDNHKTAEGMKSMRLYQAIYNPDLGVLNTQPKHDDHSHVADAFRSLATGIKQKKTSHSFKQQYRGALNQSEWDPYNYTTR
jgi:hypothetical protein